MFVDHLSSSTESFSSHPDWKLNTLPFSTICNLRKGGKKIGRNRLPHSSICSFCTEPIIFWTMTLVHDQTRNNWESHARIFPWHFPIRQLNIWNRPLKQRIQMYFIRSENERDHTCPWQKAIFYLPCTKRDWPFHLFQCLN